MSRLYNNSFDMMKVITILIALLPSGVFAQDVPSSYRWISAENGLRVRDSPQLSGSKLGVIPFGERVTYISEKEEELFLVGTNGRWTEIRGNNLSGWVFSGFLSNISPTASVPFPNEHLLRNFVEENTKKVHELFRIEVEGYGFNISEEGNIEIGDGEFDVDVTHYYANGLKVRHNSGYEWGSLSMTFENELYDLQKVFESACAIYKAKYGEFLQENNGILLLPKRPESWSRQDENSYLNKKFDANFENGMFKSFRIEEEEGCSSWWYFEVTESTISFGDGGGC